MSEKSNLPARHAPSHRAPDPLRVTEEAEVEVRLTRDEALWLKSAARSAAKDSIVPGASDALFKLAKKIGRAEAALSLLVPKPEGVAEALSAKRDEARRCMEESSDDREGWNWEAGREEAFNEALALLLSSLG